MKNKNELLHEREELWKVMNATTKNSWARVRVKGVHSAINWILDRGHWTPSEHYMEHRNCSEGRCRVKPLKRRK